VKLPPRLWHALTHRRSKQALKVGGCLFVLGAALFYPVTNWWGRWRLEKEVAACRAEGLPTTFRELLGPPPEQDLFEDPEIQSEFKMTGPRGLAWLPWKKLPGLSAKSASPIWYSQPEKGRLQCVSDWFDPPKPGVSEAEAAREVLDLLRVDSERFDRIKTRMLETPADWVAEYRTIGRLGQTDDERNRFVLRVIGFAGYRATLELAAGETDRACGDVRWMLGMEKLAVEEWRVFGLGYFAGDATRNQIWEGVVRQAWTDEQLAAILRMLEDIDYARMTWPVNDAELAARLYWVEEASKVPDHRKNPDWAGWGRRGWEGFKNASPGEVGQVISRRGTPQPTLGLGSRPCRRLHFRHAGIAQKRGAGEAACGGGLEEAPGSGRSRTWVVVDEPDLRDHGRLWRAAASRHSGRAVGRAPSPEAGKNAGAGG